MHRLIRSLLSLVLTLALTLPLAGCATVTSTSTPTSFGKHAARYSSGNGGCKLTRRASAPTRGYTSNTRSFLTAVFSTPPVPSGPRLR